MIFSICIVMQSFYINLHENLNSKNGLNKRGWQEHDTLLDSK